MLLQTIDESGINVYQWECLQALLQSREVGVGISQERPVDTAAEQSM